MLQDDDISKLKIQAEEELKKRLYQKELKKKK
jgi:hypothetical protein